MSSEQEGFEIDITSAIRNFVKDMKELGEKLKEKKQCLAEDIKSTDKIIQLDDEIKRLKNERKEFIETSMAFEKLRSEIEELLEEKRSIITTADVNGVPQKEIDQAIKMLKKDIDPQITIDVYKNISDMIS